MCMDLLFESTDGITLLGAFEDGKVYQWNEIDQSSEPSSLTVSSDPVLCLKVDSSGSRGVAGSAGKSLGIFSVGGEIEKIVTLPHEGIAGVEVRKDKKLLATAGWDHRVRLFNWKKLNPLAILKGHSEAVNAISMSPFNNYIASGGKDRRICVWQLY